MSERILTAQKIDAFSRYLAEEEKSAVTVEKYLRDIRAFLAFLEGKPVTKEQVMDYKKHLIERSYAVRSINSMLASLNSLFRFLGWEDCKVKNVRMQRTIYCPAEKELSKLEYERLVEAAQGQPRLHLILQTICGTGIRVSELQHFTVEAVLRGEVVVSCKNKTRTILVPGKLKKKLLHYAKRYGIRSGVIFRTRSGRPVNRSNIWSAMKKLCQAARVNPAKVFPHNLRKLFARTFYQLERDIAKLADILGHSSINTTRIYIMTTGKEHQKKIDRLGLVV